MFCPWKMIPSRIAQMPRITAAIRATRSCSCSGACPPLTTLTQMSCESAAAPDKVSPATTARMVANATAQMKPKKAAPPAGWGRGGAPNMPPAPGPNDLLHPDHHHGAEAENKSDKVEPADPDRCPHH